MVGRTARGVLPPKERAGARSRSSGFHHLAAAPGNGLARHVVVGGGHVPVDGRGGGQRQDLTVRGAAMCFSAEMDVAAGVAVGAIVVEALRHVRRPRDLPLGALPLLLGAHQLTEAFVWWGDSGRVAASTARTAVLAYVGFAYVVVPLLLPLGSWPWSPTRSAAGRWPGSPPSAPSSRRSTLRRCSTGRSPRWSRPTASPTTPAWATAASWPGCTWWRRWAHCSPPATTASWRSGRPNLLALPVLSLAYTEALASLWCKWAAVTSVIIAAYLREAANEPPVGSRDDEGAGAGGLSGAAGLAAGDA